MNKTYNQLKSECVSNEKLLERYDALNRCGISLKYVHFYDTPYITSGYSMGEMVYIYCNDVLIERVDNCMEYAKSCKWRGRHGRIEVRFTKKGLKDFVGLCKSLSVVRGTNEWFDMYEKRRDLIKKYINLDNCVVKKLYL